MSLRKKAQEQQKTKKAASMPALKDKIDLTKAETDQQLENTIPSEYLDVEDSLPRVTTGGTIKKKRKSGSKEILDGIKKRQTSGKMIDKQMEFATKLAQFEVVHEELQMKKSEAGLEYLCKIPSPADWVTDPRRQPSWYSDSTGNGKCAGNKQYKVLSENKQYAKITKIADCMKYMNIEAHPQLLKAWYMETLPSEASALGVKVIQEPALCYRTVAMSRTMPRELVPDKAQSSQLSAVRKSSMRFLYIMRASEVAAHLKPRDLTAHMAGRKHVLGGQLTLLILDSEKYFKKGKPEIDLEIAIIDLLVSLEIDTVLVNNADKLVTTILQYTKAVAEEPAKLCKRAVDEQADFYMRGDNKNCVTVDAQGNGLSRLWQQMLSVLPQSSLEVSRAIVAGFATPRQLVKAVSDAGGAGGAGGAERLADTCVPRSAAPRARARRLGPDLARKLTALFTTSDGNLVLHSALSDPPHLPDFPHAEPGPIG